MTKDSEDDKNYIDRMTYRSGDLQIVKRGAGLPLKKLRIPDDWIDETRAKSGETLTMIGAARPRRPKA
jgi:hypothetical protein